MNQIVKISSVSHFALMGQRYASARKKWNHVQDFKSAQTRGTQR